MVQETPIASIGRSEAVDSARAAEKRLQILHAASAVFRRQGLHATGMRDIAADLGMHVGNLYYYFESKQALVGFCQLETLRRLLALAARVRRQEQRADRRLQLLIQGHAEILNEEMSASLAHLEVEALAPEYRPEIVRQRDAYEVEIRKIISEGVAQGIFQPTDAKLACLAILGALNWTVKWFHADGEKTAAEIGESFARLLVEGLRAGGSEQTSGAAAVQPTPD